MAKLKRLSIVGVGLLFVLSLVACTKQAGPAASGNPEFDKRWAQLAQAGIDVTYIEDDRGEGLMGNVRRASRVKAKPPIAAKEKGALPERPPSEQVQQVIRGNLMAVRGCYMSMARSGQARSGKAIVSFTIGADGKPAGLKVDAPSFVDTPLPRCVTAQISHWEFPKSRSGGGQVSYPFVFVSS